MYLLSSHRLKSVQLGFSDCDDVEISAFVDKLCNISKLLVDDVPTLANSPKLCS